MGHCKHPDPDLQIEQHRPARLAHRRAATDRLGSNQEPSVAHTAAVELAPTVHHLRHVTVATTVYLYPSSSGQSLASVMPTRRLQSSSASTRFSMNPRTRSRITASIGSNQAAPRNSGDVPHRSPLSFAMV